MIGDEARLGGVDTATAVGADERARAVLLRVAPALGIVGFLLFWQVAVRLTDTPEFVLPAPSDILGHLAGDPGYYLENARITAWEALCGFLLAAGVAGAVAIVLAHSAVLERAVLPLAVLVQVTPIIAYAPAVVIWLGFGFRPILLVTSLVCFVPFLVNAVTGLRSVDPATLDLLRSVDASRREVLWKLRIPHALPFLFSAGRIAVGLALIGAVLGEFFSGVTGGLGYSVKTAQARNLPLQLWGSIYVLALIGSLAVIGLTVAERAVLGWHASQRSR